MKTSSAFSKFVYRFILATGMGAVISSCGTVPSDYKSTNPEFDMATFLNGELNAYGMVKNRSGKVNRRFDS
jgi:hypothetical protein